MKRVKLHESGYTIHNDNGSFTSVMGDYLDDAKVMAWLEEDVNNVIEPEFTSEELAQEAQDKINQEALAYLASTDWYITRLMEADTVIPEEITTLRAEARAKII